MGCGCKNKAAKAQTTSVQASPKPTSSIQEAKPEKKMGYRIIKREIR